MINYEMAGSGLPIILIHGLFGNRDNLKNLASSLTDKYQVIRIDLPNHGKSEKINSMSYVKLAQDLNNFIHNLKLERPFLIGHSMGGKVAMATALSFPESIRGLIIADIAPVVYKPSHQKVFAALNSIDLSQINSRQQALSILLNQDIEEGVAQFLLKNLQNNKVNVNDKQSKFEWSINLKDLEANYENILDWPYKNNDHKTKYKGATLFIKGNNSDYIQTKYQSATLEQFPNAQVKIIADTGHWLHAEKPSLFNRIVNNFISKTISYT